ncbi:PAS domain-containing sensor histidine kinase [Mesorhizobium sp. YM1C-6-2]|uniref:PAS domain-containing sensor histidine kinase n=1 Tax=Mesorhizobium sp. YM1C-6-2 TaxID=1827501 RepID=UPI001FDF781A|nr:PAS domain-containing sensor histidine kinase [Mesorhizobium sp. YM1C-6-2]
MKSASGGDRKGNRRATGPPSPDMGAQIAFGLPRALSNTAVSVLYQYPDLRVAWAQNVPPSWSPGSITDMSDGDFLPPEVAATVIAAKQAVLSGAPSDRLDICIPGVPGQSEDQWFDLWIDADLAPDGEVHGIVTTVIETSEQKRREKTLRVLLREVSHRSRNLLAIIQSIATQTGRHSSTIEEFLARFHGRLQSLASSQDLVTSSNWRGADLGELVAEQVSRYRPTPENAVRLTGEKPWLNPNAALHVGLALHELVANSVSYGALSRPGGKVSLETHLEPDTAGQQSLLLTWHEKIGATDNEPELREKRFGSVALERVVPASLNGSASLKIENGALDYRLVIPFGNFETG